MQLQWGTYFDASDQAGLSRLYGGIHPQVDDLTGRRVGSQCGKGVWALVQKYWDGSLTQVPPTIAMYPAGPGTNQLWCSTLRGLYYKLQTTTNLSGPFANLAGQGMLALEGWMVSTNTVADPQRFYRVVGSLTP